MTKRENLLAMLQRQPYEEVPVEFNLCPELLQTYHEKTGSNMDYRDYFGMPYRSVDDIIVSPNPDQYLKYYPEGLKPGTKIDIWGVAHEPGSKAAKHMTYMRCPLRGIEDIDLIKAYPLPDFSSGDSSHQQKQVSSLHERGLAAVGDMQTTVWETAWYLRGMEDLMPDMMCDDPIAEYILDEVTKRAVIRAVSYAKAGVDIIYLGDDIGMQHTQMMSDELYCTWILPRLKKIIDEIHQVNPDIIIFYHSCGFVTPFIQYLIDAGVDVLNPIQSECMDFKEIYDKFGDKIAFHGTIGTQTTMPFGTPEEIISCVHQNLYIASKYGGLFAAPTHMLEPEVPWENILAYVEGCHSYSLKF